MPMGEKVPNFSMIGVYDKPPAGIKFVKIHTKHLEGKYCVIVFMDNRALEERYLSTVRYEKAC